MHAEINRNAHEHKCPSCRAGFIPGDVMHIDHLDKSDEEEIMAKRSEAKAKIRQASDMLANSDGVLNGEVRDMEAIMRFLQCFYLGNIYSHPFCVRYPISCGIRSSCRSMCLPT